MHAISDVHTQIWLGVIVWFPQGNILKSAVDTDVIASLLGLSWFQILITCSMQVVADRLEVINYWRW